MYVYSCTVIVPAVYNNLIMMHCPYFALQCTVMPPPPIISGSPRNTSFFQGLNLTFTCSITLGNVVDTPVIVRGIWTRNGAERMDGDDNGRITINSPPMSSPPYEVTLRFNPLDTTDNGIYKCEVTVTPQDTTFISTATTSNSRTIDVAGMTVYMYRNGHTHHSRATFNLST